MSSPSDAGGSELVDRLADAFGNDRWQDARELLSSHPELVDPDVGERVGRLIAASRDGPQQSADDVSDLLSPSEHDFVTWMERTAVDQDAERYRSLMLRCLEIGVEGALWEAGMLPVEDVLWTMRDEAERRYLYDDYVVELEAWQREDTVVAWRAMVDHPGFEYGGLPLRQQVLDELGQMLVAQAMEVADPRLAVEAVDVRTRLVALNDEGSAALGTDLMNLGTAQRLAFELTGALDWLNRSLDTYTEAVTAGRPEQRLAGFAALGAALALRSEYADDSEDLDTAIDVLGDCVRRGARRARADLGVALLARYSRSRRRRDLRRAVPLLQAAVEDQYDATTLNGLGLALAGRHALTADPDDRSAALSALRESVRLTPPAAAERAGRLANLLSTLAAHSVDDAENETESAQVLAQIRELPVTVPRVGLVEALNAWGSWAAQRQAWGDAALAFDRACRVVENLVRAQAADTERADWLARTDGVFLDAAYCRARAGDLTAAAVAFERGRGVLARLQGSIDIGAVGAVGLGEDYAMLRSAARDRPLVMIAGRRWGGLALVVRADGPEAVWLPELAERTLAVRVGRYLAAYVKRHEDAQRWERVLAGTTRWLWRTGLGDLLSRVGPEAAVLAGGRLAVLPLHAAWRPRPPAGRMYVLDRTALSYGPSAAALITARARSAGERPESLLAVCEPTDASEAFATLTAREVDAVAAHFSRCTILRGASATGASVVEAMSGHQVWHFACHGFAARDMLRAGLVLPSGELLTVQNLAEVTDARDVTARRPASARMAVLSACETALVDGRVPDELVGLPSALVRLGVSGVVATLWAVSAGPVTALLAARFYELWLHDGLAPAQALAAAQEWTRDTTNAEKHQRFPSLLAPGPEIPQEDLEVWGSHRAHVSPSQWAAFVLVGA